MKNLYKNLFAAGLLTLPLAAQAQTITFDSDDYKAVGVYDSWEQSPLRDGRITPAVKVIANHLADYTTLSGIKPNETANIVGFQRSIYGSNLSGLRVDLKEPFRLTKEIRYVHVMINRPANITTPMMLITLGKRSERYDQSADVEQTWTVRTTETNADGWTELVFGIKGFSYADPTKNGIDIHSLVFVPDVSNRSEADEDFVCYFDQIVINESSLPSFTDSFYSLSFDKNETNDRTGQRALNSVSVAGKTWATNTGLLYNDCTGQGVQTVLPGQQLTPAISYTNQWMGLSSYIDWNRDGQFNPALNDDGTPADGSDVVSYNGIQVGGTWRNSLGENVGGGNKATSPMPAFTVPEGTPAGIYRMRFKVDWDCIDPAGNTASDNTIKANGGGIVDVLLNVRGEQTKVLAGQLNGDLYIAGTDNEEVNGKVVKRGESLRIKSVPAPGFANGGIKVTYGYNLTGDSIVKDNPQYFTTVIPATAFENDELTLPDSIMQYGEVSIEGLMISETAIDLTDRTVENPTLAKVILDGTGIAAAKRTFTLADNSHSLQDFTEGDLVGLTRGRAFEGSETGTLYIDLNRNNEFGSVLEKVEGNTNIPREGIYRALWRTEQYDFLFLINLHATKTNLTTDLEEGRFTCAGKTVNGTYETTKGVPVATDAYRRLILTATPMVAGNNRPATALVRYGHNINGEQTVQGIKQWFEEEVEVTSAGRLTIDQNKMFGTVSVKAACTPAAEPAMILAFGDEFDGTEIDNEKWVVSPRYSAAWNRYISSHPATNFVQDGALVCRGLANNGIDPDDTADFLTGARQTSNSFGLMHGYVEARILTTPHSGNFPAFWLMPMDQKDGWPTCGEIDIWETINTENRAYQTVHSHWTWDLGNKTNPASAFNKDCKQDGEWHTYGLKKEADKLTWYIDGTQVATYSKSTDQSVLDQGQWPYDKPFYIIVNQSVGNGSWASRQDPSFVYETRFDWVRAYADPVEVGIGDIIAQDKTDSALYDLSGRRAKGNLPGLYIQNGKKVIKK